MDIFGKALLDYHSGHTEESIRITRDDGRVDEHSSGIYFQSEPLSFEKSALAAISAPVLDIGCGAGRHLLWLRKKGLEAWGIDLSKGAVETCRLRGLEQVREHDIMSQVPPNFGFRFRTLTLFGNNVGIGGTFDGAVRLFRHLRALAEEGGTLILTGLDLTETRDPVHLRYHENNLAKGRRRGELRMRLEYRGEKGPEIRWYHPERAEIEELATLSGWKPENSGAKDRFFWAVLRNTGAD